MISHSQLACWAWRLPGVGDWGEMRVNQPSEDPSPCMTSNAPMTPPCASLQGAGILLAQPLIPHFGQGAGHDTDAGSRRPQVLPVL